MKTAPQPTIVTHIATATAKGSTLFRGASGRHRIARQQRPYAFKVSTIYTPDITPSGPISPPTARVEPLPNKPLSYFEVIFKGSV